MGRQKRVIVIASAEERGPRVVRRSCWSDAGSGVRGDEWRWRENNRKERVRKVIEERMETIALTTGLMAGIGASK